MTCFLFMFLGTVYSVLLIYCAKRNPVNSGEIQAQDKTLLLVNRSEVGDKSLESPPSLTLTTPNPAKSSKGHFLGKIQHCWKLVLSPLQMGQNYYLERSECEKSMKMHGAF